MDTLRELALASLKRKRKFWADAALYLTVNGLLWVIWALTDHAGDNSPIPWPGYVNIIWGFFLALDAWRAYAPWPRRTISDEDVDAEIRWLAHH